MTLIPGTTKEGYS